MPNIIVNAYIITPEKKFRHVYPANGIKFTPDELIHIVHGHIEIIKLKGEYKGKVLVVAANAEGVELQLKHNCIASKLANRKVHGDALVCEKHLI